MTGRISANDRFRRVLAIVPWIAERDGPTIAEICARFGLTRAQLLADLDVVLLVGLHPFTPDEYVDVVVEENRVWIHLLPGSFARPLRLTPEQGVALVAAGSTLLTLPGVDPDGPLARGLDKLRALLGVEGDEALAIQVGPAPGQTLALLQQAASERRQIEIDYYTYGRDERKVRVVDPYLVHADQGQWYLTGFCHLAGAERLFRIDRIAQTRRARGPLRTACRGAGSGHLPRPPRRPAGHPGAGPGRRVGGRPVRGRLRRAPRRGPVAGSARGQRSGVVGAAPGPSGPRRDRRRRGPRTGPGDGATRSAADPGPLCAVTSMGVLVRPDFALGTLGRREQRRSISAGRPRRPGDGPSHPVGSGRRARRAVLRRCGRGHRHRSTKRTLAVEPSEAEPHEQVALPRPRPATPVVERSPDAAPASPAKALRRRTQLRQMDPSELVPETELVRPLHARHWVLEWLTVVAGALLVALVVKVALFQAFVIPSGSMIPTLHDR